ncbi:hypothetical protein QUA77_11145 [Microcoleus sp. K5-D4]
MLYTKTPICKCGCVLARYENAARNILQERMGYGREDRYLWIKSRQRLGRDEMY